jgi:hypothetical protein
MQELLHRQPGIRDDPAQRASADLRVIRHYDARMGIFAAQDHMTARLATKCKARTFECTTDLPARKVSGQRRHLCGFDFDEFLARLRWDGIAGVAAVFDIKRNGLADIGERFASIVALADTTR